MAATQQQYDSSILSAEVSYDGDLQNGSIITRGDQTLKVVSFTEYDTGFKGVVYQDMSTNKYIVSFTGTQANDRKDFDADKQMLNGEVPAQFKSAKGFMENLKAADGTSISTDQIQSITGHSLGGSLAQMIGALDDYKNVNVDTYNAYGVEHLLDNLASQGETLSSNYSNINNYGDSEDLIYRASDHIGNDHSVNSDTSALDILDDAKKQGDGNGWEDDHMFDNLKNKDLFDFLDEEIDDLGLHDLNDNSDYRKKGLKDHLKDLLRDLLGDDLMEDIQSLFHQAEGASPERYDPIILDLNGDGIRTTTVANGTYFDYENDGFAESMAWADTNDGILVKDVNANGTIDNGTEFVTSLASYDSNSDGIINSDDTNFSNLKVLKGDGTMQTLTEAGVASITVAATSTKSSTDSSGNLQKYWGTYTDINGITRKYADYDLTTNPAYSIETSTVEVSDEIAALPDISSHGTVHSLHQAMALDTTGVLKLLVEQFAATTDLGEKRSIITQILYKWTGADLVTAEKRGMCDAKLLHVLEQFMGETFHSTGDAIHDPASPNWEAENLLRAAYANLSSTIYAQLESQTTLKPLYDMIKVEYNSTSSSLTFDLSDVTEYIKMAIATNPTTGKDLLYDFASTLKSLGLKENSNYDEFYNTFSQMGEGYKLLLDTTDKTVIYGTDGNDNLDGSANGEAYMLGNGNDIVYSRQGNDLIYAGDGDDYIDSCEDNDTVMGEAGNDIIITKLGDDILNGGIGNDNLQGGDGNDTYIFNLGDGNDTIIESGDNYQYTDTIKFSGGVTKDDILLSKDGNNLVVSIKNSTDSITVQDYYASNDNKVEKIEFNDGSTISLTAKEGLSNSIIILDEYADNIYENGESNNIIGNDKYNYISALRKCA